MAPLWARKRHDSGRLKPCSLSVCFIPIPTLVVSSHSLHTSALFYSVSRVPKMSISDAFPICLYFEVFISKTRVSNNAFWSTYHKVAVLLITTQWCTLCRCSSRAGASKLPRCHNWGCIVSSKKRARHPLQLQGTARSKKLQDSSEILQTCH